MQSQMCPRVYYILWNMCISHFTPTVGCQEDSCWSLSIQCEPLSPHCDTMPIGGMLEWVKPYETHISKLVKDLNLPINSWVNTLFSSAFSIQMNPFPLTFNTSIPPKWRDPHLPFKDGRPLVAARENWRNLSDLPSHWSEGTAIPETVLQ